MSSCILGRHPPLGSGRGHHRCGLGVFADCLGRRGVHRTFLGEGAGAVIVLGEIILLVGVNMARIAGIDPSPASIGGRTFFPFFAGFFPGHPFDHRFCQVDHEQAQQEKHHKGKDHLETGGQIHVIQNELVEEIHCACGENRQQGKHIDQR